MSQEPKYYALVAERNGQWMGASVAGEPNRERYEWLDSMFSAGATVKPVKDRLEYENWDKSVA